jgi:membrane protease YdiL (CAAX protease family)
VLLTRATEKPPRRPHVVRSMLDTIVTAPSTAAKPSALPFFALVFGTTWLFQLPYLLARGGLLPGAPERFLPLVVLGFFGPFLIAIASSWRDGGKKGLRALFRPLAIWRVGLKWYVVALTLPGALFLATRALWAPFSETDLGPWFYPPTSPQDIAAMLVIPFTEQIPWLGFAFPRLRTRHGSLVAIAVTGLAWSLFHFQKHLLLGASFGSAAPIMIPYMTAGAVVFGWIHLRARGSLLLAVLANAGAYLNNPVKVLPADGTPLLLHTAGLVVVALVVVLADREAWR